MNENRSDACAVRYGNKIMIIGGFTGLEVLASTEVYDPTDNTWTFGPRLNIPRSGLKAAVLNNKIYAIGGFNGHQRLKSVETLDLLAPTHSWTLMTSEMRKTRSNFGVAIIDKKILVAGGYDGRRVIGETEFYSEETNTWSSYQEMNSPKSALSLITVTGLPNRKDYLVQRQ
jgi:hypothetical protein